MGGISDVPAGQGGSSLSDVGRGAAQGASLGSSFGGGWGAVAGGILGAGWGVLNGHGNDANVNQESPEDRQRRMLQEYYAQVQGRTAPQAGPAAQSSYSSFRGNQNDLVGRLEALSKGQGQSLAAQQFQAATDRNMASQQSLAQSGRGGPLAALNAANNMGQLGAQAAQGSAAARTQEQQMALNQLGLTLQGARGSDEQTNQFNANEQNQASLANLDAKLRQIGMDDSARLQLLKQMEEQQARTSAKPSFMEKLLSGGAGALSQWITNNAASKVGGGDSSSFNSPAAQDALNARAQSRAYDNRGGF